MKAIQATGKIDAQGQLSLDHPIEGTLPSESASDYFICRSRS